MAINRDPILQFEEGSISPPINRAEQIRRDTDTVVLPKVTLYDIDYAVLYHISQNIKPKVQENDVMIDVPVIFTNAELWSQIRSRGFLRDTNKKLMSPLIAINRTSVESDPRLPMLDLNNKNLKRVFFPYKSSENKHDKFAGQINRKEVKEYYSVNVPEYVRVSYDLIIWTNLVEQLNILVEGLITVSDHMWGDFHTFRTTYGQVSFNIQNSSGDDRYVSATIPVTVDGHLLEEFEYQEANMDKAFTIKTVRFENEREDLDLYLSEPYFGNASEHISQENQSIMNRNMRRNIRHR